MSENQPSGNSPFEQAEHAIDQSGLLQPGTVDRLGEIGLAQAKDIGEPTDAKKAWLDTSVSEQFEWLGLPNIYKTALMRDGALTLRQVLMRDPAKVKGLGKKGAAAVEALLQNEHGIEPKKKPTANDIAEYCTNLSEVDARILYDRIRPGVSVEGYLRLSTFEQMFEKLDLRYILDVETQQAVAMKARYLAERFAAQFEQAKQQ